MPDGEPGQRGGVFPKDNAAWGVAVVQHREVRVTTVRGGRGPPGFTGGWHRPAVACWDGGAADGGPAGEGRGRGGGLLQAGEPGGEAVEAFVDLLEARGEAEADVGVEAGVVSGDDRDVGLVQ